MLKLNFLVAEHLRSWLKMTWLCQVWARSLAALLGCDARIPSSRTQLTISYMPCVPWTWMLKKIMNTIKLIICCGIWLPAATIESKELTSPAQESSMCLRKSNHRRQSISWEPWRRRWEWSAGWRQLVLKHYEMWWGAVWVSLTKWSPRRRTKSIPRWRTWFWTCYLVCSWLMFLIPPKCFSMRSDGVRENSLHYIGHKLRLRTNDVTQELIHNHYDLYPHTVSGLQCPNITNSDSTKTWMKFWSLLRWHWSSSARPVSLAHRCAAARLLGSWELFQSRVPEVSEQEPLQRDSGHWSRD